VFRRRFVLARRPRLFGAALIGGLGFAAGRASKGSSGPSAAAQPGPSETAAAAQLAPRLQHLADLHAAGQLTDEEFAAAKAKLLAS
jgi:hypothetical protein